MKHAVELKNLCLNYNDRVILKDVNLDIETGSIVGITGLSGAGKTSLLRIINSNIKNDANVEMQGEALLFEGKYNNDECIVATVYQDPDTQIVFPNVLDEITFGMENYGYTKNKMDENLSFFTQALGIEHMLNRNPNNLSGGEKQLVVLCAILCIQPKLLLLDECISQVDNQRRKRVKDLFVKLADLGATIIMVEHNADNLEIAQKIYELKDNHLILMNKGDI